MRVGGCVAAVSGVGWGGVAVAGTAGWSTFLPGSLLQRPLLGAQPAWAAGALPAGRQCHALPSTGPALPPLRRALTIHTAKSQALEDDTATAVARLTSLTALHLGADAELPTYSFPPSTAGMLRQLTLLSRLRIKTQTFMQAAATSRATRRCWPPSAPCAR